MSRWAFGCTEEYRLYPENYGLVSGFSESVLDSSSYATLGL